MRLFYTIFIYFLSPFVLIRLFCLGLKNPSYWLRWKERFGFISWKKTDTPVIWIHAVSVGEVNAATPIIHQLLEHYSNYLVLITTVTPTGAQTVKHHFGDEVEHRYLPYDLPIAVNQFLKKIKPVLLIAMETEIWPNLYHLCKKNDLPILLVNARLSDKSAKGYKLVSGLMNETLSKVNLIAAQTSKDAERFISFGAKRDKVKVIGNLKFDITIPQSISEQAESLKRYFSVNRIVWMAASTQDGEDEYILEAHKLILKNFPTAILILAPRHPERVADVASLCEGKGFNIIKRTENIPFTEDAQVYLLDTLGELQAHYAASELAFVGGSLVNTGGQNMLEPASLGIPVLSGPNTYNFIEISEMLSDAGVLTWVHSAKELATAVCNLFEDANLRHNIGEKGRNVIESNRGNINHLMAMIEPYLSKDATYERKSI